MSSQQEEELRKRELRSIRMDLRNEILAKIEEEMGGKIEEDPRFSSISTMDIGDLSQLGLSEDIDYAILNMYLERLRNIEDALERLEEGTYGYCEECGKPIGVKRLKALPFTRYCIKCQEMKEKAGQESKLKVMRRHEEEEEIEY